MLFALVLAAALVAARTCASRGERVDQNEAVEIAKREVDFTPCAEARCVQVRALNQGIPPKLVWIVGLAPRLDADGNPTAFANFRVDAATGEVERVR